MHAVSLLCLAMQFARSQPSPVPPGSPAEPGPPAPVAPPPQEQVTDIERSLAADAAAQKQAEPAPAAAPAPTVAVASSMNPDLSFIADLALAGFSTDSPLQTGGHDPQKNGFTLQQLELSFRKAVDPYFRFDGNIVFSQFGVELEEAYATTLALPASLLLRAGQFLTRFGRLNPPTPTPGTSSTSRSRWGGCSGVRGIAGWGWSSRT